MFKEHTRSDVRRELAQFIGQADFVAYHVVEDEVQIITLGRVPDSHGLKAKRDRRKRGDSFYKKVTGVFPPGSHPVFIPKISIIEDEPNIASSEDIISRMNYQDERYRKLRRELSNDFTREWKKYGRRRDLA